MASRDLGVYAGFPGGLEEERFPSMTSGEFLEQESRCRRLAAQAADDDLRARLLRLADEYAEAAKRSEGPKPQPPLAGN